MIRERTKAVQLTDHPRDETFEKCIISSSFEQPEGSQPLSCLSKGYRFQKARGVTEEQKQSTSS